MHYELWDKETGNLVDTFDTEQEALRAVQEVIETQGIAAAKALLLGVEDDVGRSTLLAEGSALIERAQVAPT